MLYSCSINRALVRCCQTKNKNKDFINESCKSAFTKCLSSAEPYKYDCGKTKKINNHHNRMDHR